MDFAIRITPHGQPILEISATEATPSALDSRRVERLRDAFAAGTAAGLICLVSAELTAILPPSLGFVRDFASRYLTNLCRTPEIETSNIIPEIAPPPSEELASVVLRAPPMKGLEYLNAEVLKGWWLELDGLVRAEIKQHTAGFSSFLHSLNPMWRAVGHVTFHLAENKRDETHPFAFMATYVSHVSASGKAQHLPLGRALQERASEKDRASLVALLTPVQRASEKSKWVGDLVDTGAIYQPLAWTPRQAYDFLQDIPLLESSGIIVRVPNWWKNATSSKVQVSVKIGEKKKSSVGLDAILDFSVNAAIDGEPLSSDELEQALKSSGGLLRLRGQWVEIDREKLAAALDHWKKVESTVRVGGVTFFEGMRLLAGIPMNPAANEALPDEIRQWTGIAPGAWLDDTLAQLRNPPGGLVVPPNLLAKLRPYQITGVHWLQFMQGLGLGACLADDMGLGKTIQVIAVLLHIHQQRQLMKSANMPADLLVVPASLIGNWKSEICKFAPDLSFAVAHPSESAINLEDAKTLKPMLEKHDVIITTYGMLVRLDKLRQHRWNLVILDEAQAIKNSGTRQTQAVKELKSKGRFALTGTPVENRLSDLWSLFDFLNPGLLGGAKEFGRFVKSLGSEGTNSFAPLRTLVQPYVLRRLKTDKRVIADLPDKTEVKAYCGLAKQQVVLYEQAVRELDLILKTVEGIQRRGVVLAFLMRFKQICNHPSQWLADGGYEPKQSGKFSRLKEICEELSERQEKVLIFTQFREITDALSNYLATIFGRAGLTLHGGTPIKQRREMVEAFARDDGPPYFVLSLKAGGTGLNLTAACHVIHFDRWWNPAVENQATDRAFRIGQTKNVMVHKFVCRGTVEERIDAMIEDKLSISRDVLDVGGEKMLTEMGNKELLQFVSLDVNKAMES